jgi:hypothetical protein
MKNAVFWDVTACGSCKNPRFRGAYLLHQQGDFIFLRRVRWLLVTDKVVPSSPILVTLMIEALSSSETSVRTKATGRKDGILHGHRGENLNSYIALTGWSL